MHAQQDTMGYYSDSLHLRPSFSVPHGYLPDAKKESPSGLNIKAPATPDLPSEEAVSMPVSKPVLAVDSPDLHVKVPTLKKDSIHPLQGLKKSVKKLVPGGTMSLGYDYGFLPYTVNMRSPASAIRTEGLIETDVLGIPLDVTFFLFHAKEPGWPEQLLQDQLQCRSV